eukprot:CAMPEP_0183351276 /NCGR_PEP_ID=MMETSP0164_2-20130417/23463_1 /TAXON_ID=221442 /ORGANISM="Coccolithus pelagicus ssp braarudi, Strain PLY182g" /LENGTH=334 /DNA_ID=CAMNT_0025523403 /DNA_START=41 /DNA_END=1042 /DNA_ORIENTATION=+
MHETLGSTSKHEDVVRAVYKLAFTCTWNQVRSRCCEPAAAATACYTVVRSPLSEQGSLVHTTCGRPQVWPAKRQTLLCRFAEDSNLESGTLLRTVGSRAGAPSSSVNRNVAADSSAVSLFVCLAPALVSFALQPAATQQVLEEVHLLHLLLVILFSPALVHIRKAQVEPLAVVIFASHPELAAHAEGGHRERNAALGLILVPERVHLVVRAPPLEFSDRVLGGVLLPRHFLTERGRFAPSPALDVTKVFGVAGRISAASKDFLLRRPLLITVIALRISRIVRVPKDTIKEAHVHMRGAQVSQLRAWSAPGADHRERERRRAIDGKQAPPPTHTV